MKCGFVLPCGDARTAAELAARAESAGWDGFFVSEPVWGIDTWISLAAAAMRTEHIRLGTMITPLSRMSPWKLASETATLDNLSNGRVILSVGLGAIDTGFEAFGEVTDRSMRAELLDEGLDILIGLWRGQPFNYDGKHYKVRETNFYPPPPPVQKPRIPIWVVGAWPSEKFIRRALRYDGLFPQELKPIEGTRHNARQAMPDTLRQMKVFVEARGRRDHALRHCGGGRDAWRGSRTGRGCCSPMGGGRRHLVDRGQLERARSIRRHRRGYATDRPGATRGVIAPHRHCAG